ncbi:MAG TPA: recombinase family protein [Solirubrobacteraceae bacterium]|jgi:hypothetical protein
MDRDAVAFLVGGDDLGQQAVPAELNVLHAVRASAPGDPAGLAEALDWIDSGRAATLVVPRLGTVASSLGDLVRLVDWLGEREAALVVLDLGWDTEQRAGRLTTQVLRELRRLGREREHPHRPPGRPGLQRISPDLAERIGRMRQRGMSLQAIADALNTERVPTPRGGAEWRPSSVQTVLGYRRPRPPAPPHRPKPPGPPGPASRPGRGPKGRP